jgi:hypothetical protein
MNNIIDLKPKTVVTKAVEIKPIYNYASAKNKILTAVLLLSIIFSSVKIIEAQTPGVPDPGHDWSEIGNVMATISQGGTGLAALGTSNQILGVDATGAVLEYKTLDTSIVPENGNLYYTQARFDAAFGGKTTSNLIEGSNLYYTSARANADFDTRLATKSTSNLTEGTNLYYTQARFDSALAAKTTTNVAEGANLYYTDARADARAAAALAIWTGTSNINTLGTISTGTWNGTPIDDAYISSATIWNAKEEALPMGTTAQYFAGDKTLQTLDTSVVPENGNLYYTTTRFDADLATKTTDNVAEGANLYYTDARADARITAIKGLAGGLAELDGSGKIPYSQIPDSILGKVEYKGAWDAGANSPDLVLATPSQGDYYVVTNSGSTDLSGTDDWNIGDWAIFDGALWSKVENTDSVASVNGQTGTVSLSPSDVGMDSWTGNAFIDTLGTLITGTWNAAPIDIAYGGTGATTKTGAYNALSPMVAKGDLVTHDGTDNIALTAGTDGQTLVTDSTVASGLKWANKGFVLGESIGVTVAASSTVYGDFMGIATFNATETNRIFIMPTDGTVKKLYVRTITAQPASGNLELVFRVNGADTPLMVTIPATSPANTTFSDTTNSVTVSAGDRISMKVRNYATGASANVLNYTVFVQ